VIASTRAFTNAAEVRHGPPHEQSSSGLEAGLLPSCRASQGQLTFAGADQPEEQWCRPREIRGKARVDVSRYRGETNDPLKNFQRFSAHASQVGAALRRRPGGGNVPRHLRGRAARDRPCRLLQAMSAAVFCSVFFQRRGAGVQPREKPRVRPERPPRDHRRRPGPGRGPASVATLPKIAEVYHNRIRHRHCTCVRTARCFPGLGQVDVRATSKQTRTPGHDTTRIVLNDGLPAGRIGQNPGNEAIRAIMPRDPKAIFLYCLTKARWNPELSPQPA